uniref:Exocyst component Exo84 C-terminal domain-containing protein n=1 Tax=Globodera rostochiensis TaxID=31243 RepID=A0A914HD47_GLORO
MVDSVLNNGRGGDGGGDLLGSEQILSDKFNAPEFITDFLHNVPTGEEARSLQNLRQTLAARSNSTAETIKDVVFDHYKQFIDTSKEISKLERDIYQLSTLLTEQKNLIENLMDMSGHEKRSSCSASLYSSGSGVTQQNQQLQTVMQKMDGVASVLNSMGEHERVLLQSQLMLLDPDSMQPKHPVYLVLFTNNLLVGHPTPGSVAHQRHPFSFVHNYSIESLALVNVKGFGNATMMDSGTNSSTEQHLVQLLVFPEQMFLRCENGRMKREWLESVEEAKRRQQEERALVRQATIRARRRNLLSSIANRVPQQQQRRHSKAANDGVADEANGENAAGDSASSSSRKGKRSVTAHEEGDSVWLNELVNELQDVISHRHMDEAVGMLLEWKSCQCNDSALNAKFGVIEKQVVELLTEDIKRPGGALHGTPRTLSQPFQQLIALGRTVYAVELYLRCRSVMLRAAARELVVSEEPLSYVRQVSGLFVNDILEVCQELAPHRDQLCQVLTWSSRELSVLLSLIRRHVIEVAPTMAVLTHAWRILMSKCAQLVPIGLDLSFEVNRLAAPSLKSALETNFANILDSIRLRNSEERWTPFSLGTDQNLTRFLEEMSDIGLHIEWAICQPSSPPSGTSPTTSSFPTTAGTYRCALNLTQSGCLFARTCPATQPRFGPAEHLAPPPSAAHLTAGMHKSVVHHCTSRFIISQVLPLCERVYEPSSSDAGAGILHQLLNTKFPHLLHFQRKPSSNLFLTGESDAEEVANVNRPMEMRFAISSGCARGGSHQQQQQQQRCCDE